MAQRRLLALKNRRDKQVTPLVRPISVRTPKRFFKTLLYLAQHDRILLYAIIGSGGIFVLVVLLIAVFSASLPPFVPLLYSLPWGEQQLVSSWMLTLSPLLMLFILLVNIALGFLLYKRYSVLVKLLLLAATIFSLLLAITTMKVILLVRG